MCAREVGELVVGMIGVLVDDLQPVGCVDMLAGSLQAQFWR